MPIEIKRFLCNVCLSEYQTESRAQKCENQGKQSDGGISEGQEIDFINPVTKDENVVTYKEQKGIVKLIVTRLNENSNKHQTVYFVETEDDLGRYAGACAFVEGTDKPQLYFRYPLSFIDAERERIEELKK